MAKKQAISTIPRTAVAHRALEDSSGRSMCSFTKIQCKAASRNVQFDHNGLVDCIAASSLHRLEPIRPCVSLMLEQICSASVPALSEVCAMRILSLLTAWMVLAQKHS